MPEGARVPAKNKNCAVKRRAQPVRDAMLEALAFISHYERSDGKRISKQMMGRKAAPGVLPHSVVSVGLSYAQVRERVKKKHPESIISIDFMRWSAAMVRKGEPGFERGSLPDKRPRGTKGDCT